jgi:hypothetical protein
MLGLFAVTPHMAKTGAQGKTGADPPWYPSGLIFMVF